MKTFDLGFIFDDLFTSKTSGAIVSQLQHPIHNDGSTSTEKFISGSLLFSFFLLQVLVPVMVQKRMEKVARELAIQWMIQSGEEIKSLKSDGFKRQFVVERGQVLPLRGDSRQ